MLDALPVIIIAAIVLFCLHLVIKDLKKKTTGLFEPVDKEVIKKVEVFGFKDGHTEEVALQDIPAFRKLHAGEYDDDYLMAENVTII